jgi:hypothetical protein
VHPAEVEQGIDLANQMIRRDDRVEVELVEELALPIFPPPQLARPDDSFSSTESCFALVLNGDFCNTLPSKADINAVRFVGPLCADFVAEVGAVTSVGAETSRLAAAGCRSPHGSGGIDAGY